MNDPVFDGFSFSVGLFLATVVVGFIGCNGGLLDGKRLARSWHCQSLGYQDFEVNERGTIQCVKVTRELVAVKP